MKWREAVKKQSRSDCKEALAVAMKDTPHKTPLDDADAGVLCKDKVRKRKDDKYWCDDDCPKGNKRKWW